ncbi:hypothetical protein GX51_04944 [Blastomyces parvus]|uniref:Uncharacterized protein n=1 Tax=Blastomyces parvus TaxID=2060905 RepID=A0A2B7WZC9_9EURO|nr:hypothetical protein GX51_04944 [Blastomyces parvus]
MHFSVASLGLALSLAMCVVADGVLHNKHDHSDGLQERNVGVQVLLKNLKSEPHGFGHLGLDGIYRSYSEKGAVIDYVRLIREQLEELIDNGSGRSGKDKDYMRERLAAIDSSKVGEANIWHPSPELLPPRLKDPTAFAKRRRGQRPPTSPVPGGLKDPPKECPGIECLTHELCWDARCMLCAFWGELPIGNCVPD